MRFLVAPNSLKGSLDAFAAARAIALGLLRGMPRAETVEFPIADGGDGTSRVLLEGVGGTSVPADVQDPMGRVCRTSWAALTGGKTAVIEAASAAGLTMVDPSERNPLLATSYGVGELILAAIASGHRRVLVGVGGTATVDGGVGLLSALGARFLDARGGSIVPTGGGLAELASIDLSTLDPRVRETEFVVLCDVDSPLLGERGAASVFGPQKGATPAMVPLLEANLSRFAYLLQANVGSAVGTLPRGGAAGGMAAGMAALLGAKLVSGIDTVLDLLRFDERLDACDVVITAEGRLDRSTLASKGPMGVAARAHKRGRPVVMLAGAIADDLAPTDLARFDASISICPKPMALSEAMDRAPDLLARAAEQAGRLLAIGSAMGHLRTR